VSFHFLSVLAHLKDRLIATLYFHISQLRNCVHAQKHFRSAFFLTSLDHTGPTVFLLDVLNLKAIFPFLSSTVSATLTFLIAKFDAHPFAK